MISAVDSSVILDVLTSDRVFAERSESILRQASLEGKLIICECVLAEVFPAFLGREKFEEFLADWQLEFVPANAECAMIAGEMFAKYLKRSREPRRILADFLIAAHALVHANRLLARDRGYLRDYFTDLEVLDPST
jgi:hypothetical protein